jgi:hypothetical protein
MLYLTVFEGEGRPFERWEERKIEIKLTLYLRVYLYIKW